MRKTIFVLLACISCSFCFANAPIHTMALSAKNNNTTNLNQPTNLAPTPSNIIKKAPSIEQRLDKLTTQVKASSELQNKIDSLESDINDLQSKITSINHSLTQMQRAFTLFEQRIVQLEASSKVATTPIIATKTSDKPTNAEQAYKEAFTLLNQNHYKKAIEDFAGFIKKYPKDKLVASAYYWLGELYLVEDQPDLAAQQFKAVVRTNPQAEEAATSLYKLGMIFLANGDSAHAKQMFTKVSKNYPKSTFANLANKQLKSMM